MRWMETYIRIVTCSTIYKHVKHLTIMSSISYLISIFPPSRSSPNVQVNVKLHWSDCLIWCISLPHSLKITICKFKIKKTQRARKAARLILKTGYTATDIWVLTDYTTYLILEHNNDFGFTMKQKITLKRWSTCKDLSPIIGWYIVKCAI